MTNYENTGLGIFIPMLTVLFIGLKLTDTIDWSWTWVLSPLWIPILLVLVIIGIITLVVAIASLFTEKANDE